jgi:serine/threonine protein kinase
LCSALTYLYNYEPPLAYRDIKSDNIIVTYYERGRVTVKLINFGLVKAAKLLKTFYGNFQTSTPEVLRGLSYNYRVDL